MLALDELNRTEWSLPGCVVCTPKYFRPEASINSLQQWEHSSMTKRRASLLHLPFIFSDRQELIHLLGKTLCLSVSLFTQLSNHIVVGVGQRLQRPIVNSNNGGEYTADHIDRWVCLPSQHTSAFPSSKAKAKASILHGADISPYSTRIFYIITTRHNQSVSVEKCFTSTDSAPSWVFSVERLIFSAG